MPTDEILNALRAAGGMESPSQVTFFQGHKPGVGLIQIEVHDAGEADAEARYTVRTYSLEKPGGRVVNSHGEADIATAINTTNWDALKFA